MNDTAFILKIADEIKRAAKKKYNIMEICGGHTMAIKKNGLDRLLEKEINFLSGPGCPVCVTGISDIDRMIALAGMENTVFLTFGDLFKVPGSDSSLAEEKVSGHDIRVVYSVQDAVRIAVEEKEKKRNIVFAGLGFETTAPTVASAIAEASSLGLDNFTVYSLHKTVPNALRALLSDEEHRIEAFILPGHVSAIIGKNAYSFLPAEYNMTGAISGFEPVDILLAVLELIRCLNSGVPCIKNCYQRVVTDAGNIRARGLMNGVFKESDAVWRGLGKIPSSGLEIREELSRYDAKKRFSLPETESTETRGCLCGEILKGKKKPSDCGLFSSECTPDSPKGACMVSSEGACAAWYLYGMENIG